MSFGFSVGDFLAVLELANKVRQRWNNAPEEYKTMKDETQNVSVLLETVHKLSQQRTLSDEHIAQIKDSAVTCLKVLQRCEDLAAKFPVTNVGRSSIKSDWKRLQLDPDNVRAVRDQLVSCVSSLHALLTAIQSSDDFAKHHDYYLSLHLAGTGAWATKDPKYKQWEEGDTDTLLCPGIPGSGKSILHATLVHDLRTRYEHDGSVIVIYFYCNFQRQAEQTIRNILSVLVRQMFQEHRHLPPDVKALYGKHCDRRTSPSVEELEQLLHSLAQAYRKIFILVDAMDECMSNENDCIRLLDKIFNLQRSKRATKLLVTTRWLPRITEHFGACPQLEVRAHQEDIERYLDRNIPRLAVKLQVKIKVDNATLTVQDAVKSRIVDAANGMFLLARLQFDSLTDKTSPRKLQQALLQLRGGSKALELEYDKALLRIDQQRESFREIAYKVLAWIIYSRRELSIDELQEAVAIYEGMNNIDHDTDLEEEQQLASVCAGLVRIDREAGVMRLVHYTTQEYLEKALPERNEGEMSVARDCLIYLSMNIFKESLLVGGFHAADLLKKYKLFWYATKQWDNHIRPKFEQDLIPYIDGLLFSQESFLATTRLLFEYTTPYFLSDDHSVNGLSKYIRDLSPAHICAYFGMSSTMLRIMNQGGTIDGKDSRGGTPLLWAAKYGHTEVVKVLLGQSNVSVHWRDNRGWTSLQNATVYGHLDIVEVLLRHENIDMRWAATDWETSLLAAVSKGHTDVLRLILQQKGAAAPRNSHDHSLLLETMRCGHVELVRLLIERPELSVDQPNSRVGNIAIGSLDKSMLLTATIVRRNLEIFKVVMEHPYIRDDPSVLNEGWLLHLAAACGTVEIMEYLLSSSNANPNTEDLYGQSLLCKAMRRGPKEIGKFLLKHPDVNPESSDHDGRSPLSYAVKFQDEEVVQCLLQRSEVNPESSDRKGRTPLSYAAESGSPKVVEALLQRPKVNPSLSDSSGRTPLSYAAAAYEPRRNVEALLERFKVNPDLGGLIERIPLSHAVSSQNTEVVQCLLAQPTVEPNSKDNQGRTPLSYATEAGACDIVERFLAIPNIDMVTSDASGLTPFLWAVKKNRFDIVKLFLRQWNVSSDSAESYSIIVRKATEDFYRVRGEFQLSYMNEQYQLLDLLGHCLLFLGYRDSALFAYQQRVVMPGCEGPGSHWLIYCSGCGVHPISGERFVCMTCIDVDLCSGCKVKHTNGEILESCANHEFLEVTGQEKPGEILKTSDQVTKSFQNQNLAFRDQPQTGSGSDPAVSAEWRTGIEKRYRHFGF